MDSFALTSALENVRKTTPLVHCITNYVTVNDCANAVLACGGSPIMSDEPYDVTDITSICGGLVLNIGTLNKRTIRAMKIAGNKATDLKHPIVLDPCGAGASDLRTKTAGELLDGSKVTVIRGNMSEVKALAGAASKTRGVDASPEDVTTDKNLADSVYFARTLAEKTGCIVAITGAIDLVTNGTTCYVLRNGSPLMSKITGSGCMLTCVTAAYVTANKRNQLDAVATAVSLMGIAGELAERRMSALDGNATFRTYLIDALYNIDADTLERMARIEEAD